jgi:2,5-diketo-D-gluconate reductase A
MSTQSDSVPFTSLPDGEQIPQLGFGVFLVPPDETAEAVTNALRAGYRHIDTAAGYRNEAGVTQGIHAAGLTRDDVFVTTKLWNDHQGYEESKHALKASLERLEMTHVDLYLIHWPAPALDRYVDTWRAFVELREQGLTRSIGVSNFQPRHLERIIAETGVTPAINQVELHPYFQQTGLRHEHSELGIVTEAWSPLAHGGAVLEDPAIVAIADAHDKTAAQVVLRWHIQLGNVVIPKSVTPSRIVENFDLFDFELTQDDMDAIAALDAGGRIGPDPELFVRP